MKVAFVSVLPSPYQRDLFAALAARADVTPRVFYMERAAPDSPWPERPLAAYESYLPGFWFSIGHARVHVNWRLPSPRDYDVIVCNTLMSLTGQWLLRAKLRRSRWIFWGEKLGARSRRHDLLTAPLHRAAGIAAIGSWAECDYAERFPKTRIFNIPYHCDLAPFAAELRPPREPGAVTFLFCGQMIARKVVDHLLAAFATLPENARLLLVGREAELPQMLAALTPSARARAIRGLPGPRGAAAVLRTGRCLRAPQPARRLGCRREPGARRGPAGHRERSRRRGARPPVRRRKRLHFFCR